MWLAAEPGNGWSVHSLEVSPPGLIAASLSTWRGGEFCLDLLPCLLDSCDSQCHEILPQNPKRWLENKIRFSPSSRKNIFSLVVVEIFFYCFLLCFWEIYAFNYMIAINAKEIREKSRNIGFCGLVNILFPVLLVQSVWQVKTFKELVWFFVAWTWFQHSL